MISRNIITGTQVWNELYGVGKFIEYQYIGSEFALIEFSSAVQPVHRKNLIEIEV